MMGMFNDRMCVYLRLVKIVIPSLQAHTFALSPSVGVCNIFTFLRWYSFENIVKKKKILHLVDYDIVLFVGLHSQVRTDCGMLLPVMYICVS